MKPLRLSLIVMAAGLLAAAPAFAETEPGSVSPGAAGALKQHTDGGDSPDNPRATAAAPRAWHKQHTAGGDSSDNSQAFQK